MPSTTSTSTSTGRHDSGLSHIARGMIIGAVVGGIINHFHHRRVEGIRQAGSRARSRGGNTSGVDSDDDSCSTCSYTTTSTQRAAADPSPPYSARRGMSQPPPYTSGYPHTQQHRQESSRQQVSRHKSRSRSRGQRKQRQLNQRDRPVFIDPFASNIPPTAPSAGFRYSDMELFNMSIDPRQPEYIRTSARELLDNRKRNEATCTRIIEVEDMEESIETLSPGTPAAATLVVPTRTSPDRQTRRHERTRTSSKYRPSNNYQNYMAENESRLIGYGPQLS